MRARVDHQDKAPSVQIKAGHPEELFRFDWLIKRLKPSFMLLRAFPVKVANQEA